MASRRAASPLAEMADIHKSCKSLETLLSVLSNYCEAVGATVILQKKLVKALREVAGMKTTGEIAANAMHASATIFEASSDIDSKFAKIADKEYDAISTEVKKWFKKLAKEERTHDERMANANTRIKHAGQVYEKKSKKNPRDANEEHARYINLITALGPEISQDKYNHAFNVTQRHASTTYNTAACLARVADAEWVRTCEGVRRFSPTIGPLGEWRALCEGGWSGPVPQDLSDLDQCQQPEPDREVLHGQRPLDEDLEPPATLRNVEPRDSREFTGQAHAAGYASGTEAEVSRGTLTVRYSPTSTKANQRSSSNNSQPTGSSASSVYEPPWRLFSDKSVSDSVRSLSAFPLPPTHFPIPPPRQQQSQSESQSSQSSSSFNLPRLTGSPLPETEEGSNDQPTAPVMPSRPQDTFASTPIPSSQPSPQQPFQETPACLEATTISTSATHVVEDNYITPPMPIRSQTSLPPAESENTPGPAHSEPEAVNPYFFDTDREFGVNVGSVSKGRAAQAPPAERADMGSGGIVAVMRSRYSGITSANSSTPKDATRLPLSANDPASPYQLMDGPSSPRLQTPSLSTRQLPVPPINADTGSQPQHGESSSHKPNSPARNMHTAFLSSSGPPRQDQRQQLLSDLAQLELKKREMQILERERDIEKRARDLERDRARLNDVHESDGRRDGRRESPHDGANPQPYNSTRPHERKTSFCNQRPQSEIDIGNIGYSASGSTQNVRPNSQYSYSTSHVVLPSHTPHPTHPSHSGQQSLSSSSYQQNNWHSPTFSNPSTHAPYCGCEKCSAEKYRAPQAPPTLSNLRPPAEPISLRPAEKSSKPGWMRRLSMPVGGAFGMGSEPSKKAMGIQNIAGQGQRKNGLGVFSMDGKKNVSSLALRAGEDGRRSYDTTAGGKNV